MIKIPRRVGALGPLIGRIIPAERLIVSGYDPYNDPGTKNLYVANDWAADGPGFATPDFTGTYFGGSLIWDYFSVNTSYPDGDGGTVAFKRSSQAQVMIVPSGQEQAGTTNVYLVLASASEFSNPIHQYLGSYITGNLPLPPEWLQINGQTFDKHGHYQCEWRSIGCDTGI